ncbi:flavin monoamine oxidase family protein [Paenibacillus gorillae]|uniref:flavin monoamine oxidase family protein n=1 Tax=Paenibacillus gorillae TaxID=1243662 RepID=UPI0004AD4748|nr:FAD-dependent oxidoreductase [Paenibacillus gorillae]
MENKNSEPIYPVIIIGAGLRGLRAASLLHSQGITCKILEARDRIGGRVLSTAVAGEPELGQYDLGPTWYWPQYERVIASLVKELGLQTFSQYTEGAMLSERSRNEPPQRYILAEGAVEPSMRLVGGVKSLIDTVAGTFPSGTIELNTRVAKLQLDREGDDVHVVAELADGTKKSMQARAVIMALPPRIAARRITFSPALTPSLMSSLINTPTWMAGQAKIIAVYDSPFWRKDGLSGLATSWVGPLQEIHDASPVEGGGALFGFFGMNAMKRRELGEEQVLELVREQLTRLFGPKAGAAKAVFYKDWTSDAETAVEDDFTALSGFPDYGPLNVEGEWAKKIVFTGTETSLEHGGHLEGALRSAEHAALEVIKLI